MAKKKFSFYPKRTAAEKNSHLTFDNQNHQPGWAQKDIEHLVGNVPSADQRTSVPAGGEVYKGGDEAVPGTARRTRKGKVLEK
jgi:hypothetical protein